VMPEADVAIGDVYFYQGDYPLPERQYQKALEMKAAFTIPGFSYEILYAASPGSTGSPVKLGPHVRSLLSIVRTIRSS